MLIESVTSPSGVPLGSPRGRLEIQMERKAYTATARRDGRFWSVVIHGLPENYAGYTQGRSWGEAEEMTKDAISALMDVPESSFSVSLLPEDGEARAALSEFVAAREAAEAAESAYAAALREAARVLTAHGFTVRDAGAALSISHQRVSQLTRGVA